MKSQYLRAKSKERRPKRLSDCVNLRLSLLALLVPASAFAGVYGPQASITCPVGAVNIPVGTSIQSVVNNYTGATTFCIKAGTHLRQVVVPKSGNTFIGEFGAVMDGVNVSTYAFYESNGQQTGVTIRNLEIKNYTTPAAHFGAITGNNVTNWVVTDNSVHHNAEAGIRAGTGNGWQVLRNVVFANGDTGIAGYQCHGALIEGNESYGNNPAHTASGGESGMKILGARSLTIRGNYVHDNYGNAGIWSDTNYSTTTIENNTVTNNSGAGIWHEISYNAKIRNNIVTGNGIAQGGWLAPAGIQTTNSPNVEIYGNTVTDNLNGITAMYADNGGYPSTGPEGAYGVRNLNVHDNIVQMRTGRTGMDSLTGATAIYTSLNNHFEHNTYYVSSLTTAWFAWSEGNKSFAQWQAAGNDDTGSMSLIGATTSICDVNRDNTTNVIDVQQCVNQVLGLAACTADINKDGICNIIDVQRVVNAASGGTCVTP